MHEMSLCESIIDTVDQQASLHGYQQVVAIHLEIGSLSCVETEAMHFAFAAVASGTIADGAVLYIHLLTATAWCQSCALEVMITERYDACPECGFYPLDIQQGDTMRIKDIEVI